MYVETSKLSMGSFVCETFVQLLFDTFDMYLQSYSLSLIKLIIHRCHESTSSQLFPVHCTFLCVSSLRQAERGKPRSPLSSVGLMFSAPWQCEHDAFERSRVFKPTPVRQQQSDLQTVFPYICTCVKCETFFCYRMCCTMRRWLSVRCVTSIW